LTWYGVGRLMVLVIDVYPIEEVFMLGADEILTPKTL